MKHGLTTFLLVILFKCLFAQKTENYITFNLNFILSYGNTTKEYFPVVEGFEGDEWKNVGGFGLGFMSTKTYANGNRLKAEMNISKISLYNGAVTLTDAIGNPIGFFTPKYSRIIEGFNVIMLKELSEKISLGVGVGTQYTVLHSQQILRPQQFSRGFEIITLYSVRTAQKNIMPFIPIEVNFHTYRNMFTIRYEQALLNSNRGDLRKYKKETYGVLFLQAGFRIN